MKTIERKEEVSGNGNGILVEVLAQLVKDAENVIEDVGEEVRQELADEIAIIKDQFEKKKRQIMEKAKKNAGDKTIRITDKIRETLTKKIEQASTNTISEAFEKANCELEDLGKLPSAPTTKDIKEVSTDKIPAGEAGISQAEGENVVEIENVGNLVKNGKKDEIPISTITIEDETESGHDYGDWLK
jgi:vacuolar-type H+-ATPase subunit E/Vma4